MSGIPYALTIHPRLLVVKLLNDDVRRPKAHLEGCDNLQVIRRVRIHTMGELSLQPPPACAHVSRHLRVRQLALVLVVAAFPDAPHGGAEFSPS